jgi:hypothetical protein
MKEHSLVCWRPRLPTAQSETISTFSACVFVFQCCLIGSTLLLVNEDLLPQFLNLLPIHSIMVLGEACSLPTYRVLVPRSAAIHSCRLLEMVKNLVKQLLRQLGQRAVAEAVAETEGSSLRHRLCDRLQTSTKLAHIYRNDPSHTWMCAW